MPSQRVTAVLGEVKAEMARRSLRLIDLEPRVGMSAATLSRTLNSRRDITLDELDDVCRALGLTLTEMVRRAEQSLAAAS